MSFIGSVLSLGALAFSLVTAVPAWGAPPSACENLLTASDSAILRTAVGRRWLAEGHQLEDLEALYDYARKGLITGEDMAEVVDHQRVSRLYHIQNSPHFKRPGARQQYFRVLDAFEGVSAKHVFGQPKILTISADTSRTRRREVWLQERASFATKSWALVDPTTKRGLAVINVSVDSREKELTIESLNTVKIERKQGYAELLFNHALAQYPDTKVIKSTLSGDNAEIFERGLQQGQSWREAIRQTPAYKLRKKKGFDSMQVILDEDEDYKLFARRAQ